MVDTIYLDFEVCKTCGLNQQGVKDGFCESCRYNLFGETSDDPDDGFYFGEPFKYEDFCHANTEEGCENKCCKNNPET